MDFLNKAYAQSKDLLLSMTPATRIVAGLLLAVIAISLFYLFQTNLSGSEGYLFDARVFSLEELQDIQKGKFEQNPTSAVNWQDFSKVMGYSFERWCRKNEYLIAQKMKFGTSGTPLKL